MISNKKNFKRSVLELMTEILDALNQESLKKTHITFRCNLDSRAVTKYVKSLIQLGFVKENEKGAKVYTITDKGRTFLNKYNDLMSLLAVDQEHTNSLYDLKNSFSR